MHVLSYYDIMSDQDLNSYIGVDVHIRIDGRCTKF